MPADWLQDLAKAYLSASFLCAVIVVADLRRHPQPMWIMNVVWPVTALYWGPVALWGYWAIGRASTGSVAHTHAAGGMTHAGARPGARAALADASWREVAVGVAHCGAGCTLGDIAGEWLVFSQGWTLFGKMIYAEFVVDFAFAYVLGIAFQYFAIAPMRGLSLKDGIIAALKADTVSLIAFEVGLFAWMALSGMVLFPADTAASWNYWFMMQIGMIVGFVTSYPANAWLIRKGIKEAM
jgi:hypothetical protein